MGVVTVKLHIQEEDELQGKLRRGKDEEERKVISWELEITEAKILLTRSRNVRQRNLMW